MGHLKHEISLQTNLNHLENIGNALSDVLTEVDQVAKTFFSELERQIQVVDNLKFFIEAYESESKKYSLSKEAKKAFSEVVFIARIYEFVSEEMKKTQASISPLQSNLISLSFTLTEIQQDFDYAKRLNGSGELQVNQSTRRLQTWATSTIHQIDAILPDYEKIVNRCMELLKNIESNHKELISYIELLQEEEECTEPAQEILHSVISYSSLMKSSAGRLLKSDMNKSQVSSKTDELRKIVHDFQDQSPS